jgi:hypothetical protein
MLSLDTTPAYVDPTGSGVLWPSRTHQAFLVKSIFKSQIRCPVTFFHPGGAVWLSSNTSKATPTFVISRAGASCQKVLPLSRSRLMACSILVGSSTSTESHLASVEYMEPTRRKQVHLLYRAPWRTPQSQRDATLSCPSRIPTLQNRQPT